MLIGAGLPQIAALAGNAKSEAPPSSGVFVSAPSAPHGVQRVRLD